VYAIRWENRRDGRSGWMPAIAGRWRKWMSRVDAPYLPLTADVVAAHLRGDHHIGLYPLADDDTCWWVAADFDEDSAMLDALAYMKAARAHGLPAALEVSQSGRGAHVWIFFTQPTSAALARRIATCLIGEAIQLRGSMSLTSYDRLFPSQDVHIGRGVGNLIAAPLHGKRRLHGTTVFLDPATLEPFDDQWAYLSSIARLSEHEAAAAGRRLDEPSLGHDVRSLRLPTSSKIVPRPAPIIRASFAAHLRLTATDLGPAMISAVKHAASIPNPEFQERQREPAEALGTHRDSCAATTRRWRGILACRAGYSSCSPHWWSPLGAHCTSMTNGSAGRHRSGRLPPNCDPSRPTPCGRSVARTPAFWLHRLGRARP
jgi:hypothetical protein